MTQPPDIQTLLHDLNSGMDHIRHSAIDALRDIDAPAVVANLLAWLGNTSLDEHTRQKVAEALGYIGDPAAIPGLLAVLDEEDDILVWHAINSLGDIGDPVAIPGLIATLRSHDDTFVRRAIPHALGSIGGPEAIPALLEAICDQDWLVRNGAATFLKQTGSPAVSGLLEALAHEDSVVRHDVARVLRDIGDPVAIPALAARLDDRGATWWSKQRVGDVAAEALEKIDTPEALTALEQWRQNKEDTQ